LQFLENSSLYSAHITHSMAIDTIHHHDPRLVEVARLVQEHVPALAYHNFNHISYVYRESMRLAAHESHTVDKHGLSVLGTAAYLHDVVYTVGANNNEELSARFAHQYLPHLGYTQREIKDISKCIMATRMPQSPTCVLEKILCDADLSVLGDPKWSQHVDLLRQEQGVADDLTWWTNNVLFLARHEYHTSAAREYYSKTKYANLQYAVHRLKQESRELVHCTT